MSIETSNKKVKKSLQNTHCIICKSEYTKARVGKIYCSNRCKQFGYNHKDDFNKNSVENLDDHKEKKRKILHSDFITYQLIGIKIKRFKELNKRNDSFLQEKKRLEIKKELEITQNHEYSTISHRLQELDCDEMNELDTLRTEVGEFGYLENHYLKIEQWSFFRLMFPKMDNVTLYKIICQFSKDYIEELDFCTNTNESISNRLGIKNKFIHHCRLITEGFIKFV
jgi:hypothetical protein